MAVKIYLGVEGVLLRRVDRTERKARGFEAMPYALEFLSWCVSRFDCYWLTRLDRCGGNNRIKRAFRIAWNEWQLPGELEILFEAVNPTVWDDDTGRLGGLAMTGQVRELGAVGTGQTKIRSQGPA